jgi:hypothetical protein
MLDRLSKRNIRSAMEKRLSKAWGKRSESDSDELYQRILRELYHTARLYQLSHPRYSADSDGKLIIILIINKSVSAFFYIADPLTLERLLAQRTTWNNDNENVAENMS